MLLNLWTRHLEQNDKRSFEVALFNDTLVLGRLLAIIEEFEDGIEKNDLSENQFDNPNWAFKSAFLSGKRAGLAQVKQLLTFLRKE